MAKYVDISNFKFDLSGLMYINPFDFRETAEYFARQILSLPAVEDMKPVERGKWVKIGCMKNVYCSHCGKVNPFRTDYCPHCGAEMEGEK